MVESPTYYNSLSPILQSLKKFDMANFPLQAEVLYAKSEEPVKEIPSYLKEATFQTAVVCLRANTDTAEKTEKDKPEATIELSNNVHTSHVFDFKEQNANDMHPHLSSIASPRRTDASMTTARNFLPKKKENVKPTVNEVYEGKKYPDDCTVTEQFECGIEAGKVDDTFVNNTCEDQMDTDPISEKSLHIISSPKTELCQDMEESTNINTLPTSPSVARTSRRVQNPSTKENLGKRMNVERFLEEIRNSTSKSLLEESQCEALVHALESKLAIIQGEPIIIPCM